MNYVYKVVKAKNNKYYSIGSIGKYKLEYKLGQYTKRKKNTIGIFVFSSINYAKEFKHNFTNGNEYYILKSISGTRLNYYLRCYDLTEDKINLFYASKFKIGESYYFSSGTLLYKSIKPIEIVS